MTSRTVYQVLGETVGRYGPREALFQPYPEGGRRKYRTWTWAEVQRAAEEIAAGLRTLGVAKGDIVALNSETRAEFYLADLGILTNGSVAAALYSSYPVPDLLRTVAACDARVLFVEDPKTFQSMREASVERFVLLTGEADGALSLDELRRRGREALAGDPGLLARILGEYSSQDDAILYLTSGATGEPKMAMVTHASISANVDMGPAAVTLGPDDCTVAWLPSAHIAQRIGIEMLPIRTGTPVYFAESLMKLPQDIKAVKPTFFLAPPRMWERVYTSMSAEINRKPKAVRTVFYAALGMALEASRRRADGKRVPWYFQGPLKLADKLMFRRIRERFGGRMRLPVSGAAPLGKDLAAFYDAIGMPLVEGYGLTEGGVVCLNPPERLKIGSIGKPLPHARLSLGEDNELLVSSPTLFSRYYKDPAGTDAVLRNGVLRTGDIAHIDEEGYIFITGRKKEMIVASNGKKVYPSRVENLFKVEPLISQVLLIGDRLPYMTALFTINPQVAETLEGMNGLRGRPLPEVVNAEPVVREVRRVVKRVNQHLAPFEQIRKWRLLEREFTIEHGELTATMKLRRAKAIENFKSQIDELYAGHEE
ncbi:MAG: AMP-dependent synthetase/ligase [Bryobacteraceae bacterium]